MRILHLGKYYAPQRGGIERHVQDLAEWFCQNGDPTSALVHQPSGHWRSTHEVLNGVEVRRSGNPGTLLYAPISPGFPFQLHRAMKELQPDLLHLHLPNPSCFFALASKRARSLPWIVHWHADVSPEVPDWRIRLFYRLYRPFEQAVLKRAAAIVVTSEHYRDASVALKAWRTKTRVFPLGIGEASSAGAQAPEWPNSSGLRLVCVGRLSHYKGHAVLLNALARMPHASLVVIGSGEEADRLQAQVERLQLTDRVRLAGEVDEAQVHAAYEAADCVVLPSLDRSEAFGITLLEAMRSGKAVIASAIAGSGVTHVVEDGVTGLLVKPGDVDALVAALERLREPELRQRLGEAGRVRWKEEFTLDRSAGRIRDLYRDVLGRRLGAAGPAN